MGSVELLHLLSAVVGLIRQLITVFVSEALSWSRIKGSFKHER